jgi:hypothetical protein
MSQRQATRRAVAQTRAIATWSQLSLPVRPIGDESEHVGDS